MLIMLFLCKYLSYTLLLRTCVSHLKFYYLHLHPILFYTSWLSVIEDRLVLSNFMRHWWVCHPFRNPWGSWRLAVSSQIFSHPPSLIEPSKHLLCTHLHFTLTYQLSFDYLYFISTSVLIYLENFVPWLVGGFYLASITCQSWKLVVCFQTYSFVLIMIHFKESSSSIPQTVLYLLCYIGTYQLHFSLAWTISFLDMSRLALKILFSSLPLHRSRIFISFVRNFILLFQTYMSYSISKLTFLTKVFQFSLLAQAFWGLIERIQYGIREVSVSFLVSFSLGFTTVLYSFSVKISIIHLLWWSKSS